MVIYHDDIITTAKKNVRAKVGLLLPFVKSVSQMFLPGERKAGVRR